MIRLIFLSIFFLLSLLTIFKAPTYHLWLGAIVVTEFSVILIIFVILLLACGIWFDKYQLSGTVIGLISICLLAYPIVSSYRLSKHLDENMTEALGTASEKFVPFNFSNMFKRAKHVEVKSFIYSSGKDKDFSLDFYPAKANGIKPCIIVVHGGSWKSGDNKQLPELNTYLSEKGYHVAAINYRLAPKYKNPSAVQDVKAALEYLKLHALELNIDTHNFVLLGRSAGAQIALLAAYTLNFTNVKGVVDFYGPADMVWGYSVPSNPLVMDSRKVMEDYLGGTYKDVPDNYSKSSALNYVSKTSVPTLIIHGEKDVLVAYEHSIRLQKALAENGVKHYFLSLPWATHGFDFNLNGPGGQLSTYAVLKFLKAVTY